MTDFIICACCAAEAAQSAVLLRRRLDGLRVPHDVVEREGDEVTCTPLHIRDAMDRHPGKIILFVDGGCQIVGTRDDLVRAADVAGDIGLHVRTRVCPCGTPILTPHAETLVLRPTAKAHVFVSEWIGAWERAASCGTAHDAILTVVLAGVPDLSVTLLASEFCTTRRDNHPLPVILHERVGTAARTTAGRRGALLRWLRPKPASSGWDLSRFRRPAARG
ncbi:MAG: hypothetical protein J0H65_17840 [Rhizobiales bacterium]|nr:hypothetical protein [Hyphomicrobiales bacterium]